MELAKKLVAASGVLVVLIGVLGFVLPLSTKSAVPEVALSTAVMCLILSVGYFFAKGFGEEFKEKRRKEIREEVQKELDKIKKA